MAAQALLTLV
jgi:hypothetical protein